jgi:CheY-like chemotaxis protein
MSQARILLVEDNLDEAALTLRALKRYCSVDKQEIAIAHDGAEALDYLFNHDFHTEEEQDLTALPTLILLDLKLPKLNGLQVLERLRLDPRTTDIPVIILSTSNEESDRQASYQLGCNGYICKSIDLKEFGQSIEKLNDSWLRKGSVGR